MNKLYALLLVGPAIAAANACTSYSPDLGAAPFLCGTSDPKCPDGYSCVDDGAGKQVCVAANGGAVPDGGGFKCNDDSSLGQNDTTSGAFQTPVDGTKTDFSLAGLAICPAGDKDNYAITLSMANKGLRVTTTVDSGTVVNVSILNAGGTSIANGTPMGSTSMTACAPNLPTSTYYASAFASANVQQNYKLQITVVDNCVQ
jgi:hypothetical protein